MWLVVTQELSVVERQRVLFIGREGKVLAMKSKAGQTSEPGPCDWPFRQLSEAAVQSELLKILQGCWGQNMGQIWGLHPQNPLGRLQQGVVSRCMLDRELTKYHYL